MKSGNPVLRSQVFEQFDVYGATSVMTVQGTAVKTMLLLVLGNNFLLLFVGWEGVGLCSYLLIGYYFKRQ